MQAPDSPTISRPHLPGVSREVPLYLLDSGMHLLMQKFSPLLNRPIFLGPLEIISPELTNILGLLPLPKGTPPAVPCAVTAISLAPLHVTDAVNSPVNFHCRACDHINLPIISVSFHGFHRPYLLCLSLTHLQHPSPHSCCRTQLLLLSPKQSMHIKHLQPPSLHSFLPLVDLTDCRVGKGQRGDPEGEHIAQGCPSATHLLQAPLSLLPSLSPSSPLSLPSLS